ANTAGLLITDQLWLHRVCDVVDFEATVFIRVCFERFERAQVVLGDTQFGGDFGAARCAVEFLRKGGAGAGKLLCAAPDLAHVALMVDHHDAVCDPHLVAVRGRIVDLDGCHNPGTTRIGDVDDRRAQPLRIGEMPDKGISVRQGDLAGAGKIEMSELPQVRGERGLPSFNDFHRTQPTTTGTAMPPSDPKSACKVSPFCASTPRVNDPASTR